jgi:hypothetical protein
MTAERLQGLLPHGHLILAGPTPDVRDPARPMSCDDYWRYLDGVTWLASVAGFLVD